MMRFRWAAWRALTAERRAELTAQLAQSLEAQPRTALYSLLGHKGDLMFVHFRDDFAGLNQAELALAKLGIADYFESAHSYLSIVELGLYESTGKAYADLTAKGAAPHSDEWNKGIEEVLQRQRSAMASRLYPDIPAHPYICFYPMDRRRGEHKNWYQAPMAERARMMHEHGLVGRRYAGEVRQIISGSIGFDDWEWGVDLFADHPLVFKKLIYEMRFDEVSAVYALFGQFFVGLRLQPSSVAEWLHVES
jgi:hydrogen peroxide-dependent heme synthase